MRFNRVFSCSSFGLALALLRASAGVAHADTFAWTDWTSATPSNDTTHTPGSATGTVTSSLYGTITVTYSGQNSGLLHNFPSWTPTSTFTGGVVGNAPPAANNAIQIEGGQSYGETVTFSSPVANPVFAILSLGAPGTAAYFDFTSSEPFNVLGGGPSAEYGGSSIVKQGDNIFGNEGDGLVQFIGTYSSISFTTPNFENFYGLTFGEDATVTDNPNGPPSTTVTPEPETLSLLGLGLAALPLLRYRFARR